jgi:hypothetical protein
VHLRPRAEVDEQAEEVRGRRRAAGRVGERVQDRQRAAGRQRLADFAEEGGDLGRRQVVHEVEAEHGVVPGVAAGAVPVGAVPEGAVPEGAVPEGAAQVAGGRVAVREPDAVRHPGRGDDLPADGRAARQVEDRRGQPGMTAAQLHRVQAVTAADVEQFARAGRQPQFPGDLRGAQPRELVLAADVALPVRVAGRRAVRAGGAAALGHVGEFRPPGPVIRGSRDVLGDRQPGRRVEPAP